MNTKHRFDFRMMVLAGIALAGTAQAQLAVSNVTFQQRTDGSRMVDIRYTLSGGTAPYTVAVKVSNNGGTTYAIPATTFTGAVGANQSAGTNKLITWNAAADWSGNYSTTMRFNVTATDSAVDEFALIPAGSFQMGNALSASGDGYAFELPVHAVQVSAFYMAKYEVTKTLWDEVKAWGATNGYTDLPTGAGKAANHPVQSINWYAMVKWCNARSQKEGLTPCYYTNAAQTVASIYKTGNIDIDNTMVKWSANGYRLPTEAEWEKAARGGLSGKRFPWGDTITHSQANYNSDASYSYDVSPTRGLHPTYDDAVSPCTSPVGSFAANGYGLYDMAGNVWESCWDWYDNYHAASQVDPRGPATQLVGPDRICRGGLWGYDASVLRCSGRFLVKPDDDSNQCYGFRLARSPDPAAVFVLIPQGSFQMGNALDASGDGFPDELPVHTVQVSAFYMENYEVSKALWDKVRTWGVVNGYTDLPAGEGKAANHPVQLITWFAMVKWCNARSEMNGRTPCYYTNAAQTVASIYKTCDIDIDNTMVKWSANGYRLPTEAEWEKAARGGLSGKRFPWGDVINHSYVNYRNTNYSYESPQNQGYHPTWNDGIEPYTAPVGSFTGNANGYGLYDMAGNVWEWCWDRYESYPADSQTDPRGAASAAYRVLRGGGWTNSARFCRAALRNSGDPVASYYSLGFRVVRSSVP